MSYEVEVDVDALRDLVPIEVYHDEDVGPNDPTMIADSVHVCGPPLHPYRSHLVCKLFVSRKVLLSVLEKMA